MLENIREVVHFRSSSILLKIELLHKYISRILTAVISAEQLFGEHFSVTTFDGEIPGFRGT